MSNLRDTDLMIVGRNNESYQISFADVASKVTNGNTLPDATDSASQVGTLDDRYVNITGGTMTGTLTLAAAPENDLEAATKLYVDTQISSIDILPDMAGDDHQAGTLDTRYVEVSGDVMIGDLLLSNAIDGDTPASAAVRKDYVDAADTALSTSINALSSTVAGQVVSLTNLINGVADDLDAETERAVAAENALDDKIDALKLGDLANVNVGAVSDRQVVSYDAAAEEFIARTIVLSSTLEYKGEIELSEAAPAAGGLVNGDLFVNSSVGGSVDASFGAALQAALPTLAGGEFVAWNGSAFEFIGNIGGGLTYTSFSVNNLDDASGGGALAYNSDNGLFAFTPADVESRIPRNVASLAALPG